MRSVWPPPPAVQLLILLKLLLFIQPLRLLEPRLAGGSLGAPVMALQLARLALLEKKER